MNTKMKVLSLAMVGAFGYVGVASAACPTDPAQPTGAWSQKSNLGGALAVTSPGLDGSECKLEAKITTNGPGANAFVRDNSPSNEPRYRAQFWVNADEVAGVNAIQSVKVFSANSEASPGPGELVRLNVVGNLAGSQTLLGIATYCPGQAGDLCSDTVQLAPGVNKVEIDWDKANNTLKVWLNSNTEANVTKTLSPNISSSNVGVDFAVLGLAAPSTGYRTTRLNKVISFDKFDSRRTTFIGF